MWLLGQIVFYLLGAFVIGAAGSWVLRSRLADDSHEHLRQRFRQMVSSSEMERDAAKLRVRELSVEVRTLEEQLEQLREPGDSTTNRDEGSVSTAAPTPPADEPNAVLASTPPAEVVESRIADVPADDAGVVEEEDGGTVDMGESELNGVLADGDQIGIAQGHPTAVDVQPALPEPANTNGGGIPQRFELAEEGLAPSEPDESAEPQDTIMPHTWASADPAASSPPVARRSGAGPPVHGRPFSDLGDIAPATSEQLRSMGIHNTSDLNRHFRSGVSPSELARSLGVEVRKVRRWRVLSELMEVPKVGPESAWLLEISGLASVGELAAEDPGELSARMAALNADQGLGLPVPERAVVESWVQWASSSSNSPSAGR